MANTTRKQTQEYPRLPLWVRRAGTDDEGNPTTELVIIKPGEPGYDDEYEYAVAEDKRGHHGVHYAMPDEVESWDKENGVTMQESHRRPAHVLEGTNVTISGEAPIAAVDRTRRNLGEWMTHYGPEVE